MDCRRASLIMGDSLMVGEDQRIPNNDNSENALENRTDRTGDPMRHLL